SSTENRPNLDSQAERFVDYCTARGSQVAQLVKEVGSGINDARPKFFARLEDQTIRLIVVEHQDRAIISGSVTWNPCSRRKEVLWKWSIRQRIAPKMF